MDIREQIKNLNGLYPLTVFCGNKIDSDLPLILNQKFDRDVIFGHTDIDTVRTIIAACYKIITPTIFFFSDVQNMSIGAMNSLLKITEEPPNNAVFVLTVDRLDNLLNTIRSRAMIVTLKNDEIVYDKDLETFCNKVYDNIYRVPYINALKISSYIKFKDSDIDKFDLYNFLTCMRDIYFNKLKNEPDKKINERDYKRYMITERCLFELIGIKGIKKESLFDSWIINILGVGTNEEKHTGNSLRATK